MNQQDIATTTPYRPVPINLNTNTVSGMLVEATSRYFVELKLSGNKKYKFWHKVQTTQEQLKSPRP